MNKLILTLILTLNSLPVFAGGIPTITMNEWGQRIISNTKDAVTVGGYVIGAVCLLIAIPLILRMIGLFVPKKSVQVRHFYHHYGK